ncbi:MAG: bifunctional 23S rRNA (guanine(2069)-N(7))-methyltransferase RlmK/23S rRNA (guanine(2445)-N(2))-methyltransferase RlmL [Desulfuromonadaceae bacterium]|nr:bifunctional 23S rRNA (guanine(2069)-N(7))-methyltransferase RlmK/23S rRNA (guanine(2445)-N(2))-methyltransferase RlmL [Desulfuromonadaceae bacterium]
MNNQTSDSLLQLFVTAPKGLEQLLHAEILDLGSADARQTRGGVICSTSLELMYRICLWSRFGGRVLLPLAQEHITDEHQLYTLVRGIAWEEHFPCSSTFAVDCNAQQSQLTHTQFIALKAKDGVVDRYRDLYGERPDVDTETPDWRLNLHLYRDQLIVSLDLSGTSLHKRGYRIEGGKAPLKENLAAALLQRAGWPEIAAQGGALLDPMCGSGTLVLEAALMAADCAPGLMREHFGFLTWTQHNPELWHDLRQQARARCSVGMEQLPPLCGYDQDRRAIAAAEANAARAGLGKVVVFRQQGLDQFGAGELFAPLTKIAGLVVTNPPYGERMGEVEALRSLYQLLGERLRAEFTGWKAAIFTGTPALGPEIGLRALRKHHFFNGALACELLHFEIEAQNYFRPPIKAAHGLAPVEEISDAAQMFANRLKKNLKQRRRWAKREGLECYRIYDADLPDYAVAIDVYANKAHVQEYQAPAQIDARVARRRLREIITVLPEILGVDEKAVHVKVRKRQRGTAQYEKHDTSGEYFEVDEYGLKYRVNLSDYLDTGLFLDHRPIRKLLRNEADGKDFLNLFAYTGSASVAAAAGGAASTTTVDMSATYLEWARSNMRLNGFTPAQHTYIQADCLQWLKHQSAKYGLIFLDPPSFSNSKRMQDTLDVQRDHMHLIDLSSRLLTPTGVLIFSTNLRRFKLDEDGLHKLGLEFEDITPSTIPPDFERSPSIHHCWRIWLAQS